MALHVYSTLSRKKEPFHKSAGEPVSMYVCGPTVYKPSHIGHMVGPVVFDTVKRYLTYLGYPVTFVVNITDVDDKLIEAAGRAEDDGAGPGRQDDGRLPRLPDRPERDRHRPLPQGHRRTSRGMIALITRLIESGHAYPANGDVYFDVSKDDDYGKLSGFDPEQLEAGTRAGGERPQAEPGRLRPVERRPSRTSRPRCSSTARGARGGPAGTSSVRP